MYKSQKRLCTNHAHFHVPKIDMFLNTRFRKKIECKTLCKNNINTKDKVVGDGKQVRKEEKRKYKIHSCDSNLYQAYFYLSQSLQVARVRVFTRVAVIAND